MPILLCEKMRKQELLTIIFKPQTAMRCYNATSSGNLFQHVITMTIAASKQIINIGQRVNRVSFNMQV